MSGSDVDRRRTIAEGTNFLDSPPPAKSFAMDPEEERRMMEEFDKKTKGGASASSSSGAAGAGADSGAGVRFNAFRPDMTVDNAREREVQQYIHDHQTWRASVPMMRWFEYWRLRADFYPYIKQSDAQENFFLRGITCHPRLSDFPTCKEVIRDYFMCRDEAKILAVANPCAPMKEQLSACINMVFLRNHARGDKKFNDSREEKFDKLREAKFNKMLANADTSIKERGEFKD